MNFEVEWVCFLLFFLEFFHLELKLNNKLKQKLLIVFQFIFIIKLHI